MFVIYLKHLKTKWHLHIVATYITSGTISSLDNEVELLDAV